MHKPRLGKDSPAEGSRAVIGRELERAAAKDKKAKSPKKAAPKTTGK